ncbi:chitinase [Chitinophaga skermanii]|uniref:chitinase n=2 Tax=Chitinophaga skermanii TaxID=331697 RepID=A0A327R4R0_9BACT|nr:chitinase [Chitinophaga skermanii]
MALCFGSLNLFGTKKPSPKVVIGYVGGYRGLVDASIIDASKLSIINYAFVNIKDGEAFLTNEKTDTVNFRTLSALKKINPSLKIVISIGGWAWSENFSDAVLTEAGRKKFATSAVAIVAKYKLDGVDIDWEYPGLPGEEGNVYRPEDKQNFTLMFKELRHSLDSLQKKAKLKQKLLLTTAVGASKSCIEMTEMDKAQQYLDYVNLMTYDYKTEGSKIAGHHTNLYGSTKDPEESSADRSIRLYIAAGVPPAKIVMGIAFYGRGFKMKDDTNFGLNQVPEKGVRGGGFTTIKEKFLNDSAYTAYWDENAQAPYLYNAKEKVFITYDDEKSVIAKCNYVTKYKLGGVMFWEYSSDPKGYLLNTIHVTLK